MDTGAANIAVDQPLTERDQLAIIREHMPAVYASIQRKAAEIGNEAFVLVRKGLRGEPRCFFAIEGGWVMGTPFAGSACMEEVAHSIVELGCAYVCIWPDRAPELGLPRVGGAHGTA